MITEKETQLVTALGGAAISGLVAVIIRWIELRSMKRAQKKKEKDQLIESRKSGSASVARDDLSIDEINSNQMLKR